MNEEKTVGYLMLLPSLVVMVSVAFFPILFVLWLSLYRKMLIFNISRFVGLENYMFLAWDDRFWRSSANTLYFTAVSVGIEFFLGLSIALLINREFRGRGWTRAIILVPWVVPTVVSAKMWEWMYNAEFGLFNYLLRYFGFFDPSVNWLGDKFWAIHAAILMDVWKTTPFVALLLTAGLQIIPQDLYQAAKVDGCSTFQIFYKIVLPLAAPGIFTAAILVFIFSWNEFLFALTFTATEASRTVPVGIALFPGIHEIPWGDIAAATVVVTFPLVIMVFAFQRRIVQGLTAGAIKG